MKNELRDYVIFENESTGVNTSTRKMVAVLTDVAATKVFDVVDNLMEQYAGPTTYFTAESMDKKIVYMP